MFRAAVLLPALRWAGSSCVLPGGRGESEEWFRGVGDGLTVFFFFYRVWEVYEVTL